MGYSPWGRKEWDTTERLNFLAFTFFDILTAIQGGTSAIIKVKCCVYTSDLSGVVSAALDKMKTQVKAMSNDNPPFWTPLFSWIKGDWWKNLFVIILLIIVLLIWGPCILQCIP